MSVNVKTPTFSNQVIASLAHAIASVRSAAATVLVYKHIGEEVALVDASSLLELLKRANTGQVTAILLDFVTNEGSYRYDAPTKYVFDGRMAELKGWLRHDGWTVDTNGVVAASPLHDSTPHLRDRLLEELSKSGLDANLEIDTAIQESTKAFSAEPPRLNEATTQIRIALETLVRNAAAILAARANAPAEASSWGTALAYLRQGNVLTKDEELALASAYTFISPGAHIPKGIEDIEWARVSRSIAISMCYFVISVFESRK